MSVVYCVEDLENVFGYMRTLTWATLDLCMFVLFAHSNNDHFFHPFFARISHSFWVGRTTYSDIVRHAAAHLYKLRIYLDFRVTPSNENLRYTNLPYLYEKVLPSSLYRYPVALPCLQEGWSCKLIHNTIVVSLPCCPVQHSGCTDHLTSKRRRVWYATSLE